MKTCIAKIPHRQIVGLGKLLGAFLYVLATPHRRLVKRNLHFCYPSQSREQLTRLSRRVFENAGIALLEICQSAFMSPKELYGRFRVRDEANVVDVLRGNKGAIIISGHLGNWELALQFFSRYLGKPLTGVAMKMRSGWVDHWLHRRRTRFGVQILDKKGALPKMTETLRRGDVLALLVDQSRRKQGVPVTFFGREATATPAPALLAIRCKSPIVPIFCVRERDGALTILVKEPLELKRTNDLRTDLQTNTQMIAGVVEDMVRAHPEQWFWILRPWKMAHPELYREWDSRSKRRKKKQKKKAERKPA